MDAEKRRTEVDRLLRQGSNSKLLRGSTGRALDLLAQAHRLAHKPDKLRSPWPELTSYRLAHLTLRRTLQDQDTWEKVDSLLAEAARCRELGPWPRLYRLAVLHRINAPERLVKNAFDRALEAVSDYIQHCNAVRDEPPSDHAGREAVSDRIRHVDSRDQARLQDPLLNSLELCAYFLGRPYDDLEGLRGAHDVTFDEYENWSLNWSLVGPCPEIARIRYSRDFALAELNAVARKHPSALLFGIEGEGRAWYRLGQTKQQRDLRYRTAKILANLLARPHRPVEDVLPEDTSADNKRQACKRFREDLARITGLPAEAFYADRTARCGVGLPRELLIYGACSPSAWL